MISSDLLASGSWDKTVILWNITSGSKIRSLNHANQIWRSIDLYDTQTLITGSLDQIINLWDYKTGQVLDSFNTSLQIVFFSYFENTNK